MVSVSHPPEQVQTLHRQIPPQTLLPLLPLLKSDVHSSHNIDCTK